jgi:hypothetical protein
MIIGRYFIKPISYKAAMQIIVNKHYLRRSCPCSFAFGLYEKGGDNTGLFQSDLLVGVIVYGTPSSATLRIGICGEDESLNVIELTRLWIDDCVPKNGESYLIGNTLKLVDKEIIVSFSEIEYGHIGTVYQATNFIYTGLSAKRTDWKIKGFDGHSQSLADKYSADELRSKYGDLFYYKDRPRKHRYIYFNAKKKRKKQLIEKLKYKIEPYPKKQYETTNTMPIPPTR